MKKNNDKNSFNSFKQSDFKKIMLGRQTFEFLIENNYLYVDKTKEIHDLINNESIVFLSRPRRFGKSLLVSTLKNLFSGNKELFEGFYIYDHWNWDKSYPVIHLDLSKPFNENHEEFINSLNFHIDSIAKNFSINLLAKYPNDKLTELIEEVHKKHGKVVILVDEYDAPILDNINNQDLVDANRRTLQSFYLGLKNSDEYIDFIFITGISKFIHTSIFSKLNNPTDISLLSNYSTICGITHDELLENYQDYLHAFAEKNDMYHDEVIAEFNRWYDGYSFDGEKKVFNPFSTLSALKNGEFSQYWFSTGTPHFLVDILKKRTMNIDFENMVLSESDLNE
ncbi:MAG: AAA family ATPase, partial [Methanobrevibacter sp.]|nr:AAA family ATPase [Candidatus Methanovirga australis]